MKIGLVSSAVPLVRGGYRFIVDWLADELRKRGHEAETIYIPSADGSDTILMEMAAFRAIQFADSFDRVITFRPPAHVIRHPVKVIWFIHHIRVYYDLWGSEYCPVPDNTEGRALRDAVMRGDTRALNEAHKVFSNSQVVADRLRAFNDVPAEVLYPPIHAPERFRSGPYGEEIVCVCRIEHHKRQHLLIEAMGHTRTGVRLRLCGASSNPPYVESLRERTNSLGVADRVVIDPRWIEEDEKVAYLEGALAAAYVPLDEDSYGYPTLEAAHAARCTVTMTDCGGVPEFVQDGVNGFLVTPEPVALAAVFDRLFEDRALAQRMGRAARARVDELGVDWDTVVARLLA